ncbi:MarR family protein [Candidatus Izimaplasma bacterium HR1]|jgi:DNA-binding MarR family transcriptional regulator|uniref:MarR family winged helix-turn-helix transcriptional regulator n=1 Tax=Candidatus Izimoplasma sp. HR1 TaxID=1541959 RepID=UPI0004F89A7C|nr:MarR family protein [Candidatus Izimaplasma bacterium HR1]
MEKEEVRVSLNKFLKLYFDACNEVYEEINFNQIKGIRFKYLKEIHKRKEVTLTELADHFSISKPTVNEVINHFKANGIIEKRKSEKDKRINYISLTDIGVVLATTNTLESRRAVDRMFDKLPKKDIKTLVKIFSKLGGSDQ